MQNFPPCCSERAAARSHRSARKLDLTADYLPDPLLPRLQVAPPSAFAPALFERALPVASLLQSRAIEHRQGAISLSSINGISPQSVRAPLTRKPKGE